MYYKHQVTVYLLRLLHSRDLRCRFCPEGHWVSNRFTMNSAYDKPSNMHFVQYTRRSRLNYRPFRGIPVISMDNLGIEQHEIILIIYIDLIIKIKLY